MTEPAGNETSTEDTQAQEQLAAAIAQQSEPQEGQGESDKDWKAEAEKWKAHARKHETNAKANAEAAKKLAEFEDAQKSEAQRLNDQLAAAQVELQGFRVAQVRQDAAREAGLDPDLAEYITETDPDKAVEQAKRLAARMKPQQPAANFQQGARPAPQAGGSKDDLIRGLAGFGNR